MRGGPRRARERERQGATSAAGAPLPFPIALGLGLGLALGRALGRLASGRALRSAALALAVAVALGLVACAGSSEPGELAGTRSADGGGAGGAGGAGGDGQPAIGGDAAGSTALPRAATSLGPLGGSAGGGTAIGVGRNADADALDSSSRPSVDGAAIPSPGTELDAGASGDDALREAGSAPPAGSADASLCAGLCAIIATLGCSSHPADCALRCSRALVEPCLAESRRYNTCAASRPATDFICDERGRGSLREGLCTKELEDAALCLARTGAPR